MPKNIKNNKEKETKVDKKKSPKVSEKVGSYVLIVEDDNYLANAYRLKLQYAGYEMMIASDGEEAQKLIKDRKPRLIILDLVLPHVDGFTVLEEIKKDSKTKGIPVIVASNLGQKEDLDHAMKLGADDYFIKSNIGMDEMIDKIKSHLKK